MRKKTRVLFTLDEYHVGGITSFVKQYISILHANGYEVTILGSEGNLQNPRKYFPKCEVIVLPQILKYDLYHRFFFFISYLKTIHHILLTKKDIEVIHFSTVWSTLFTMSHPLTWKKKRVITYYGSYDLERKSMGETNIVKEMIRKTMHHFCLQTSNDIITFSKYAKKQIISHYSKSFANKVAIIPGIIRVNVVKKYSRKKPKYTVLNYGRAEQRKGIVELIQALKHIKKENPISAVIASPVVYYQSNAAILEEYESSKLLTDIHLLHSINEKQIDALIKESDVFVIPSLKLETFGLTILESLSKGLLVLGTPIGAIPEILNQIDSSLIMKSSKPRDIASKIEWFMNLSTKEKQALQKRAAAFIKTNYSEKVNAQKLLQVYEK